MVGQQGVEEKQRFIVPVMYFNHPLFMQLLKEAEEEYGFDQKGTITIPCNVEEFRQVRGMIDRERSFHQHHHHHHVVGCFRAWRRWKQKSLFIFFGFMFIYDNDDDEKILIYGIFEWFFIIN